MHGTSISEAALAKAIFRANSVLYIIASLRIVLSAVVEQQLDDLGVTPS
jgi:hypothetical protein